MAAVSCDWNSWSAEVNSANEEFVGKPGQTSFVSQALTRGPGQVEALHSSLARFPPVGFGSRRPLLCTKTIGRGIGGIQLPE
jgi:hypothetical protein